MSYSILCILIVSYSNVSVGCLEVPQDGGLQALRLPGAWPLQGAPGPCRREHPDAADGRHHQALTLPQVRLGAEVGSIGLRRERRERKKKLFMSFHVFSILQAAFGRGLGRDAVPGDRR